jgi:tetratricopeptide (TPR) repeat protein
VSFQGWVRAWSVLKIAASVTGCGHVQGAAESRLTTLDQAKAFLQDGRPELALPLLIELQLRSPADCTVAKLEVEAYLRSGRAAELVSQLLSQPRERALSHYMLGLVYGSKSRGEGSTSAAIEAAREFERAISLKPDEAEFHHRLGVALLELRQYEESAASLSRALELDPDRTSAHLPLVKALHASGNTDEALRVLGKWLARRPAEGEIRIAKALIDEIVPPFAGLPSSWEARFIQGVAMLQEQDDPLEAIGVFEALLREHPEVAIAHTLLALCFQRLDDAGRAVDELRQAVALAPRDGRNHSYLGEFYLGRGQVQQAEGAFRRALELNPLLDEPHLRLGELALEKSDFKIAGRHLAIAALLSPGRAVRAKLAQALQLDGDYAGAERELRALLKTEPENADLMLRLGLLHLDEHGRSANPERRSRSRAEAIRWLREVLRIQGDNVTAARALESMGAG